MFIVSDRPTFSRSVEVRVPVDGGFSVQTLTATFRVLPTEEAAEFDLADGDGSTLFLRAVIVDLGDLAMKGQDGILAYSDAVRDQVLGLPYARSALARTYFEAVSGAAAGN